MGMQLWNLDCEPREVQVEAVQRSFGGWAERDTIFDEPETRKLPHFGHAAKGWCHFLEMRLGKTPLALNEFKLFMLAYNFRRLLIISPNAFKYDWVSEAEAFKVGVDAMVLESKTRSNTRAFLNRHQTGASILVTNYEALGSDANMDLLSDYVRKDTMIVADESVLLKNPRSMYTEAAFLLQKECGATRLLTGLPNPQAPTDLYAQFRYAYQLSGLNYYAFRAKYAKMGGWKGKKVVGTKNAEDLNEIMKRCAFVAERKMWKRDHKDPDFQKVNIPMAPAQLKHYEEMNDEFITTLSSGVQIEAEQIVSKYAKLVQISSGFIRDAEGSDHWIMKLTDTPKYRDLAERLQFASGKVIVMVHHTAVVKELHAALKKKGYNPAMIASSIMMKDLNFDIVAEKRRFNEDPECRVMVAQLKAVKYGHTLVGTDRDPCNTIVYFENSYSLDDRIQSEQRNQGVNIDRDLHIVDYYSSEAEGKVVDALVNKKDLASAILHYYRHVRTSEPGSGD